VILLLKVGFEILKRLFSDGLFMKQPLYPSLMSNRIPPQTLNLKPVDIDGRQISVYCLSEIACFLQTNWISKFSELC